jgi:hypothetical protein
MAAIIGAASAVLSTPIACRRGKLRHSPAVRFAARPEGQRVAEVENVRHLEAFGTRQQPVAQGFGIQAGASARDDDGVNDLAEAFVGNCQKRMMVSKSLRRIARQASAPAGRRSICSLRSKPDENAAPAPVTISARKPASRSISSSAKPISASMAALSALARSGRFRVRRATGPILSTVIVAKRPVMGIRPHRVRASQHGCRGRVQAAKH